MLNLQKFYGAVGDLTLLNLQKFCGAVGDLTLAMVGVFGLPQWLDGKESAFNAGDVGSIPGLGRSPGRGHGNPLQYSCLENPTDRAAWQATVHRVTKSWTRVKRCSMHAGL